MFLSLVQLVLWLQPAATGGGGASAGGGQSYCMMQAGIMLLVLLFTYFFMIRPEQKRREETEALLKSLRKGMKVRTSSGILGEIVSLDEHTVMLAVADKVKINVLRSHIAGLEPERREAEGKKDGAEKVEASRDADKDRADKDRADKDRADRDKKDADKGKKPDEARS